MMKIDMHVHTTHSDGSMSPCEIIDLAKHKGIDGIAITDHDIVSGVSEAVAYGREVGLEVIPGIELSTSSTTSVHVLGYGIDWESEELQSVLSDLLTKRQERAKKILARLAKYRIYIDESSLPSVNVGRSHIARELKNSGYVATIQEAFDKYLGENKLAYVPSSRIVPVRAVQLIRNIGGIAVIAHPMQLYNSHKLEMLIEGLLPYGLDGLEVYYPNHTADDVKKLTEIADKYSLIKTGGSDFHGIYKAGTANMLGACTCDMPEALFKGRGQYKASNYKRKQYKSSK